MAQSRTTKVLALSLGTFLTQLVGLVSHIAMVRLLSKEELAKYLCSHGQHREPVGMP